MFKLNKKVLISISAAAALSLGFSACVGDNAAPGNYTNAAVPAIDGGVSYPLKDGKTGPYYVNTQVEGKKIFNGRVPTKAEYDAWNTDVMPDGTGLPDGEGSVEDGDAIYEAKCLSCHGDFGSGGGGYPSLAKGNAYTLQKTLTNQRLKPDMDGPVRVFGSYWPKASTLWWYIKDAMPHPQTGTLTDDETYALVAFILNINEMKIDGEEVDDEYVLDREKFLKIKMPNENGFVPNIDGPEGPENVRAYFANGENFGGQKVKASERCMTNCQEPTAKVVYIKNGGISDFHPPIAEAKDLPKEEGNTAFDAKKAYAENCAMCHDTGVGPAPDDKAAWRERTAKGVDKVYANGINGINAMPPKGGASLSDAEFKSVVDYLINQSK
jgi:S-disulfanyl-L-cysteine oxidoreductase SoxD